MKRFIKVRFETFSSNFKNTFRKLVRQFLSVRMRGLYLIFNQNYAYQNNFCTHEMIKDARNDKGFSKNGFLIMYPS
jgi:hypothetical protein